MQGLAADWLGDPKLLAVVGEEPNRALSSVSNAAATTCPKPLRCSRRVGEVFAAAQGSCALLGPFAWAAQLDPVDRHRGEGHLGRNTFIWKEVLVPELAPASLSLPVTVSPSRRLRPTPVACQANLELELEITAATSSSRNL